MRKVLVISLLACVLLASCRPVSKEQDYVLPTAKALSLDSLEVDDFVYGIFTLYPDKVSKPSLPPKGYKPVYISHYGRHGCRYVLRDSQYNFVYDVLTRAYNDGMLTPLGTKVYEEYSSLYPSLANRAEDLSPLGQLQHRTIARRMYGNYKEVFRSGKVVAYSTNLQRTMMSMASFCEALKLCDPSLDIYSEASRPEMYYLNPHSPQNPKVNAYDQRYRGEKSPWWEEFDAYCQKNIPWRAIAGRLFTKEDYIASFCKPVNFVRDLFYISIDMQCVPQGRPSGGDCDGFFYAFTLDELHALAECDNYLYYIAKGRYAKVPGRGWALSESLLNDFIVKADQDLFDAEKGAPCVRLRFGHDGCMMAMFALMGLPGWDAVESDPSKFKDIWHIEGITMASNIQMVFYKNSKGEVIFKMMFNEEDMELPLESVQGRFYRWEDFKTRYIPCVEQGREILEKTADLK